MLPGGESPWRGHSEPVFWARNPGSLLFSSPPANCRGPSPKKRAQDDSGKLVQITVPPLPDDLRLRRLLCGKAEPFRIASGEAALSATVFS